MSHPQGKHNARKGLWFRTMPHVLTLHLQLFRYDTATLQRVKIHDRMRVPLTLNPADFISEDSGPEIDPDRNPTPSSQPGHYELTGVLLHAGSAGHGHYTACTRREGQWLQFNDETVSALGLAELQQYLDPTPTLNSDSDPIAPVGLSAPDGLSASATPRRGPANEGGPAEGPGAGPQPYLLVYQRAPSLASVPAASASQTFSFPSSPAQGPESGPRADPGPATAAPPPALPSSSRPPLPATASPALPRSRAVSPVRVPAHCRGPVDADNAAYRAFLAQYAAVKDLIEVPVYVHRRPPTWVVLDQTEGITAASARAWAAALNIEDRATVALADVRLRRYDAIHRVKGRSWPAHAGPLQALGVQALTPLALEVCLCPSNGGTRSMPSG